MTARLVALLVEHRRRIEIVWAASVAVMVVVAWTVGFVAPFWYPLAAAIPLAVALGASLGKIAALRLEAERERALGRLPASVVQMTPDDDPDQIVLAVTRRNGEQIVVSLPPDYDPRDDGGRMLLREVVPELMPDDEEADHDEEH